MIKHVEQPFTFPRFARLLFEHRKQAGLYGLSFVIISFNLCFFFQANMRTPSTERMINAMQLFCFGIMGIVNVWFFYKRNILAELSLTGGRLAFISLLFIIIGLVLFIYYFVSGNDSLVMAFASSGAFFLPFLVYQGWTEFMGIPEKQFPVWRLPEESSLQNGPTSYSAANAMQVQLTVTRHINDEQAHSFPVTTSGKFKLGKVFEKFIEDQRLQGERSVIETRNKDNAALGWQFFERNWGGWRLRVLNPLQSMLENKLTSNSVIIVKRIAE